MLAPRKLPFLSQGLAKLDGVPIGIIDLHLVHSPGHLRQLVAEFRISVLQVFKQFGNIFDSDIAATLASNFAR